MSAYMQLSPVEIQTPTHRNLMGYSVTPAPSHAACVIAQQYSSTSFAPLRSHSRKERSGARSKNMIISIFKFVKKIVWVLKLLKSGSVYTYCSRGPADKQGYKTANS
jgi:hypothetical protein